MYDDPRPGEVVMTRAMSLLGAALLTIGLGSSPSFADPQHEVNGVRWNIIRNWRNTHATICQAINYNQQPMLVTFYVSPVDRQHPHLVRQKLLPQHPNGGRIKSWLDGTPNIVCDLRSVHPALKHQHR